MEHTMGTLYEAKTGNHQGLIVSETTGENIAVVYDKAHAAYIVRAVNSHEALLAALNGAAEHLNEMGCEHETTKEGLEDRCIVCIVNESLRKAEGRD